MPRKAPVLMAALLLIAGGIFLFRVPLRDLRDAAMRESVPKPIPRSAFETPEVSEERIQLEEQETAPRGQGSEGTPNIDIPQEDDAVRSPSVPAPTEISSAINLSVPFTSQAPHANWDLPWQEFCEEAAVLMLHEYLSDGAIPDPDYADARLHEIKAFEESAFGYYEHTTAEETARILREFYGHEGAKVYYDITIEDIQNHLRAGRPVIVPAAGRLLGNPYFRQPGPVYHMLIIKGFADGKFITNDNGTRRGKDYVYDEDVLFNAIHDWNAEDITKGRKAMIVVE